MGQEEWEDVSVGAEAVKLTHPDMDWDHTRRHKWAPDEPPSDWPKGVKAISMSGLSLFGLDDKGQLYWDGTAVETKRRLDLSKGERWFALIVGLFTIFGSIGAVAQGWAAAHQWSCQTKIISAGCPK